MGANDNEHQDNPPVSYSSFLTPVISVAQHNFEIGGYVGGQINRGVDLSTTIFHRIEVQNGTNYGRLSAWRARRDRVPMEPQQGRHHSPADRRRY